MSFIIFKKNQGESGCHYQNTYQGYKLAGYNLLYRLWKIKNYPVEQGWSVSADEILKEHDKSFCNKTFSLVIDFHPSSPSRIGLVEIEAIHIYTYGEKMRAFWSPIMLELRDVYYDEDFDQELTQEFKQKCLEKVNLKQERGKIIEFLYLQGDTWNWGRNGSTNAAFIHDKARKYFANFFN